MAIDQDPLDRDAIDRPLAGQDPLVREPMVDARERGSFMPFVIGALVVVVGIIAFMMYGRDNSATDNMTTGSTAPPAVTAPTVPPKVPAAPSANPTPANPASPAAPSTPNN